MAKETEFKPKYVAKVPVGKKSFRYFYTQAEYKAYLNGEKKKKEETNKAAVKTLALTNRFGPIKNEVFNVSIAAKNVATSISKNVQTGAKAASNALQKTNTKIVSQITTSKSANVGKKVIDKLLDKTAVPTNKVSAKTPSVMIRRLDVGQTSTKNSLYDNGNNPITPVLSKSSVVAKVTSKLNKKQKTEQDNTTSKIDEERRARLPEDYVKHFLESEAPTSFDDLKRIEDDGKHPNIKMMDDVADVNEWYFTVTQQRPADWAATQNCAYCTVAYDLRQRGYDVEAGPWEPTDPVTSLYEIKSWYNDPKLEGTRPYDPNNKQELKDKVDKVTSDILKQGEGARGHFCLYWSNGGAHDVVYEVRDGRVILLDCQKNAVITDIESYMACAYDVVYFRTDNIEPNEKVLSKIRNDDD